MFCREGTGEGVHVGGGPRPNSFALRKRGEERGDEVGLVLVRLAIEARRIGGDEAGEIDGFTAVAVALMWSGDEVTGVCGLRAVEACINDIVLGEFAGDLDSRRKEWVDARLEGCDGRLKLGVETNAAVNGTCC